MRATTTLLITLLLLAGVFSLATVLQPQALKWTGRTQEQSILKIVMGDSRRMFANHFFIQADVSFHSGYYPSIFDQARQAEERDSDVAHPKEDEGKQLDAGFLGPPTDWVDRFGRRFRPVIHTHLHGQKIGELLPWLRISADLDPHRIETYLVCAYWLERIGKTDQAVLFVREGLRANPGNPDLLYELGLLYFEGDKDFSMARNLYLAALRRWDAVEGHKQKPDQNLREEILGGLVRVAEQSEQLNQAVGYLEQMKAISPDPDAIQKLIDEIKKKLSQQPQSSHAN